MSDLIESDKAIYNAVKNSDKQNALIEIESRIIKNATEMLTKYAGVLDGGKLKHIAQFTEKRNISEPRKNKIYEAILKQIENENKSDIKKEDSGIIDSESVNKEDVQDGRKDNGTPIETVDEIREETTDRTRAGGSEIADNSKGSSGGSEATQPSGRIGEQGTTGNDEKSESETGRDRPDDADGRRDGNGQTQDTLQVKSSRPSGINFAIKPEDNVGVGGAEAKYKNNVAAIKLLKQLQLEQRMATYEEQKILAKYAGWGGLKQAFNPKDADWRNKFNEIKSLLSEAEYTDAYNSTVNAHYTSTKNNFIHV